MPMNKSSTPHSSVFPTTPSEENRSNRSLGPKEATLKFLRLFARSYHADPRLPKDFQGLVLN